MPSEAPSPSVPHYNRGAEEFRQRNYPEAVRHFRAAVEADPRFHRAWAYLGLSLAAADQVDEAIEAYRKCIDIDPQYHKAYNNVGELYRRKGLLDYAAMVFKMATEIDATQAHYFYNLGITYLDIGMQAQAEEALAKAHGMAPGDFEYASDLAQARFNLGRFAEAAAALEAFLQAAPRHEREKEVEARLKMLRRRASEAPKPDAGADTRRSRGTTGSRIAPTEPVPE
jgi:tetratricopeptide (TPR) repeat protein